MGTQVIITPRARLSFPFLFDKQPPINPTDKPKYRAVLLFPKATDLSVLKGMAKAARDGKWPMGADGKSTVPKNFRTPFRNGDEKEFDGYKDHIFISISSDYEPGVLNMQKQEVNKLLGNTGELYAGCYVIATVNAYAYSNTGNNGVAFGMNNIMKVGDGEPFASKTKAVDDFAEVAAQVGAANKGGAAKAGAKSGGATAVADEWDDTPAGDAGEPDL